MELNWRVHGRAGTRVRSYGHAKAAFGEAMVLVLAGKEGCHVVVEDIVTGNRVSLDRVGGWKIIGYVSDGKGEGKGE